MLDINILNTFLPQEFVYESVIDVNRPQWFKLWGEKYATALDIYNLDDLPDEEKLELFTDIGIAFVNALFYFMGHDEGKWFEYKAKTREGRVLWNALRRDIDQSYRDYDRRVENGSKGGRPKSNPDDNQ